MTQRFCFIGNSHLAAVKLGWEDIKARYSTIAIDFFGTHGDLLEKTGLNDGKIEPLAPAVHKNFMETAGTSSIDIGKYDRIFIIAAGFGFHVFGQLYQTFAVPALKGVRPQLISRNCFCRAGRGLLEATAAMHLTRLIRSASDVPIVIAPQPLLAEPDKAARDDASMRLYDVLAEEGDGAAIYKMFREVSQELQRDDLCIAMQPQRTRTNVVYTRAMYSAGSIRLHAEMNVPHSDRDRRHMNARYGAEMITTMFSELGLGTGDVVESPSIAPVARSRSWGALGRLFRLSA